MTNQSRIPAPNYTQMPNVVLDLMADMEDTEFRVVIAIARQTFGWHKKRDKISLSQLEKLTGLSRQGVVNGIAAGIERGLIERKPDPNDRRGGIWYRLLVNSFDQSTELTSQEDELVQQVDQSTELTRTSQLSRPELVNSVDTQKKPKEKKEIPPPPPQPPRAGGGGGRKPSDLERLFGSYGIGTAHDLADLYEREYPDLDLETIRQSCENVFEHGSEHAAYRLLRRLKSSPPEPGKPYPRAGPVGGGGGEARNGTAVYGGKHVRQRTPDSERRPQVEVDLDRGFG